MVANETTYGGIPRDDYEHLSPLARDWWDTAIRIGKAYIIEPAKDKGAVL
jgi:hypothetical protein